MIPYIKWLSDPEVFEVNREKAHSDHSYTVNGKQAGFYARISKTTRIDSNAADIPVLIERSKNDDK